MQERTNGRSHRSTRLLAGFLLLASATAPAVVPVPDASAATTITCPAGARQWDGGSGNWNVASNWTGDTLPVDGDDVCILDPAVTVTMDASPVVDQLVSDGALTIPSSRTLTIGGDSEVNGALALAGSVAGAGTLSVSGSASWTSGTMSAAMVVTPTGTLDITGGTVLGTLTNHGTVNHSGQLITSSSRTTPGHRHQPEPVAAHQRRRPSTS